MHVQRHDSPFLLLQCASGFLYESEAENNLLLGLCAEPSPLIADLSRAAFFSIQDADQVVGVALICGGNLVVSRMPLAGLPLLASAVRQAQVPVPGVVGPTEVADRFADVWTGLVHCQAVLHDRMRILVCHRLNKPAAVPGSFRRAHAGDVELLTQWFHEFHLAVHVNSQPERCRSLVEQKLPRGSLYLWEDGEPVSLTAQSRETQRGAAINYVYTPENRRGRGYATALVAAVTDHLLSSGRSFCCLYADQDNPTPNHIYERLGYRPVCEARHWDFVPPAAA